MLTVWYLEQLLFFVCFHSMVPSLRPNRPSGLWLFWGQDLPRRALAALIFRPLSWAI